MLEKRKEEADQIKKEDDEKRKVGVQNGDMSTASYIMFWQVHYCKPVN